MSNPAWGLGQPGPQFSDVVRQADLIQGWMTLRELQWLYNVSQKMESIIEIGSFKGRSTYVLCSGCRGTVYSIDPFMEGWAMPGSHIDTYPEFTDNMKQFSNLVVIRSTSEEASRLDLLPHKIDMIFIDGNHSYDMVLKDLELWEPRVKFLVSGHDYRRTGHPGVERAVNSYYGSQVDHLPDSIWYQCKNGFRI